MSMFYLKMGKKEIRLPEGELILGRDPSECALVLKGNGISRVHCLFTVNGGEVWVEDLKSKNGVAINGKAVDRKVLLSPGEMIQIGEKTLTFFKK